jgi:hypothetical protein
MLNKRLSRTTPALLTRMVGGPKGVCYLGDGGIDAVGVGDVHLHCSRCTATAGDAGSYGLGVIGRDVEYGDRVAFHGQSTRDRGSDASSCTRDHGDARCRFRSLHVDLVPTGYPQWTTSSSVRDR